MASYENIFPGVIYTLEPSYHFQGYHIPTAQLGGTTSIQTANQLKEVNNLLNSGMKVTELSVINPEIFEMIPKEHLKEINRLNKLTGAESTIHAPIIDPSGFTEQGWSEENRRSVEKQFEEYVKRSFELNPNGNIPVTIHASTIPGTEQIPKGKEGEEIGRMVVVDRETGKLLPLEKEEIYRIRKGKEPIFYTPEERLNMINYTEWNRKIANIAFYKKEFDETIEKVYPELIPYFELASKNKLTEKDIQQFEPYLNKLRSAGLFLGNIEDEVNRLYEKIIKYGEKEVHESEKNKKILETISKEWKNLENEIKTGKIKTPEEVIIKKSFLIDRSLNLMQEIEPPKQYVNVEEFAKEKASETLSNVALKAYKQFKEKAPIISIENPPYGSAIASGTELKNLVEETRNKFIEKLTKEGKSKEEAKKIAEKLIGVTWDTSHISMIRRKGFGPEKIVEETKKIAPYLKHVHFNDNFGSTHTDLPPGMGSVPMKDILEELEKHKFEGKKIFEGGNFFQHFQTSPFPYQLEYASSPVAIGGNIYWNQMGYLGNYYIGHGPINPQIHHTTYGLGFMTLPLELGGEIPGTQSKFAGTPNQ